MIGSILGGALALGSQLYGGIKSSNAMKQMKNNLEEQQRKNEDWYNRRYNEDPTQRADAQRVLQITAENIRNRNRAAAGAAAVAGGTEESVAAERAANAKAMADAASQIAAAGDRRKDAIENHYLAREAGLNNQLNQMEVNRANSIAKATGGATSAAGSLGSALDELLFNKDKEV